MDNADKVIEDAGEAVYYKFGLSAGMNGAECERVVEIVLDAARASIAAQALRDAGAVMTHRANRSMNAANDMAATRARDTVAGYVIAYRDAADHLNAQAEVLDPR